MKLTIIETGRPPEVIAHRFDRYPVMLEALLTPHVPGLSTQVVALVDDHPLPAPEAVEAVLVTGSPHGVYDPVPWIGPLKSFLRRCAARQVPQVGICFGHQLMAEAFGGRAAKAPQGWGIGRHSYAVDGSEPFAAGHCGRPVHLAVSHQDQVLDKPEVADVFLRSEFTPNAGLVYRHAPVLSVQGHPEFAPDFADALIRARRGTRFPEKLADAALETLAHPLDGDLIARWIGRFYAANRLPLPAAAGATLAA
jgi:GMP synthase-like glutamine amidotransferase